MVAAATTSGPRLYTSGDARSWKSLPAPALRHGEQLVLVSGHESRLLVGAVGADGARLWRGDRLGEWTPVSVPAPFASGQAHLGGSAKLPDADLTLLGAGAQTSAFAPVSGRRS